MQELVNAHQNKDTSLKVNDSLRSLDTVSTAEETPEELAKKYAVIMRKLF